MLIKKSVLVALGSFAFCLTASASTIETISAPCMGTASLTCAATAVFTFSTGQVLIQLTNNLADPTAVAQSLSAFSFTLSNGSAGSLASSSGIERSIAGNGTFTDSSSPVAAGWSFSEAATSFTLDDLTGAGSAGPAHTLIGAPGTAGIYDGNSSITGNGPHNPFLEGTVTFTLDITGVNSDTRVTAADFQFGTLDGQLQPGTRGVTPTPEPMTFVLSGAGLVMAGLIRRRKRS